MASPETGSVLTPLAERSERASTLHVASGRDVVTYEENGWPLGFLTGHAVDGAFRLEHVVVFPGSPPTTLLRMLRSGVAALRSRGYTCAVFNLPHAFPKRRGLARTAARLGATRYHHDATNDFWVRYP